MAVQVKNYDPVKVIVSFGEVLLRGYMDGTFIEAARTEDSFTMEAGAGGDITRTRNRNRSGRVTVTLQEASLANDELSAIAASDEKFGDGIKPLQIKNLNGTTLCNAESAWIVKPADVSQAKESSGREWMFDCAELLMNVGGLVV